MSPDFYDDTKLAQCSYGARLLYPALWQLADRCGVFDWDPPKIKKYAFGYDSLSQSEFDGYMNELLAFGFIRMGNRRGKTWGLVPNLAKWQHFHKDEKERHRDVLDEAAWSDTVPAPEQHRADTVPAGRILEYGVLSLESGIQSPPALRASPPPGEIAREKKIASLQEHASGEYDTRADIVTPEQATAMQQPGMDTETNARPTRALEAFALEEYRGACSKHARTCPVNFDRAHHRQVAKLVGRYPKPEQWRAIFDHYVRDERYRFAMWSLGWLTDPKVLDEVAARALTADAPTVDPFEEGRRYAEEQERKAREGAEP